MGPADDVSPEIRQASRSIILSLTMITDKNTQEPTDSRDLSAEEPTARAMVRSRSGYLTDLISLMIVMTCLWSRRTNAVGNLR